MDHRRCDCEKFSWRRANRWQEALGCVLPRTPKEVVQAWLFLAGLAVLALAAPAVSQTAEPTQAQARNTILVEQATREPFGPPHALPVLPALGPENKVLGAPAPIDPRPEGAVLETRPAINPAQRPAFAGQTRAPAHRSRTPIEATTIARGLSKPWGLAFLPDGRMLVTEKTGTMRIVSQKGQVGKAIGGVPPVLYKYKGEAGLLDVVIDPAFSTNRRLYFSFVGFRPDGNALMVASAQLSANASELEDVVQLLTMPSYNNPAHYGGRLLIGADGKLYIGASERMADAIRLAAQDPKSPMGKILRINTDASVPQDNPYAQVLGADPTVYSIGTCDVQGFAIQPGTGAIWATDRGPQGGDEIDIIKPGHNYGWPLVAYGTEYNGKLINGGRTGWPSTDQPVYYWDPAIAPSGATFYAGSLIPEWRGDLFVAALAGQHIAHLVIRGDKVVGEERLLQDQRQRIRDVEQGPDGALWAITDDDGRMIRIAPRAE